MKHPVDTSTWGKFKVGELFDFSGCKQVKSQHNLIETDKENGIPFVVQSNANNMVKCYVTRESLLSNDETIYNGNAIMLGVMTPVVSYQEHEFGASQSIALRADFLNPLRGLFIATVIKSVIEPKYNYANIPGIQKYKNEIIPLPLKPGTNHADYSQDDIDWDYMEGFMSRVQEAATKRLANLPETGQKSKTPVDVSGWGEFKVGELFDMFPGRRLKKGDFKDGDIPFVMASSYNNGVVTTLSNPISKNENFLTADIFGNVFYQKELVGYGDDNCGLKLKYRDGRPNEYLFLATMISSISVQASFTNKLRGPWYIEQAIQLPLKQGTNLFDYTHDDIDWDYMESFMSQFKNLAKNRVEQLTSAHDCDILTM